MLAAFLSLFFPLWWVQKKIVTFPFLHNWFLFHFLCIIGETKGTHKKGIYDFMEDDRNINF
jgi:hypothetical protein